MMSDYLSGLGNFSLSGATGEQPSEIFRFLVVPFGKYEVTVKLNPMNEFVGITGITINKDFLSDLQRQSQEGYLNVDDFYRE
jgi:hypothetical protein